MTQAKRAVRDQERDEEDVIEETAEQGSRSDVVIAGSRRRRMVQSGDTAVTEDEAPKGRPTPTARAAEETQEKTGLAKTFAPLIEYFQDVFVELRKVKWPTREEALRLTYIVIAVTLVAALFLGGVSYLFSLLTTAVSNDNTSTLFGVITIVVIVLVTGGWLFRDRLFGRYE